MPHLLDANILCRLVRKDDPQHEVARDSVDALLSRSEKMLLNSQAEREFWVVATRPREQNGLGMMPEEAAGELEQFSSFFPVLPDLFEVHNHWRQIVLQYRFFGKRAHDAGYVATMLAHRISALLTFNVNDFARYGPIITVHSPEQILA